MTAMKRAHAMPFGATVLDEDGVRFRLWAPAAQRVDLCFERGGKARELAMPARGDGWFETIAGAARPGDRYRYRIDGDRLAPDPASRFQPSDVHGASEIIDPSGFDWSDEGWRGRPWEEAVIYELNTSAFDPRGTFDGVARRLDYLANLGVTAIELMPVADWPGRRGWGYDGVYPFAPDAALGRPEALKSLVQAAHARGLMVFLDVVYNHFGPEGNYLHLYAPRFYTDRHHTLWGQAINFDGAGCRVVRDFFVHNALYWIEEFGMDGLRLDAVHAIADDSEPDILIELAEAVRRAIGSHRHVHLVLENGDNEARYLARDEAGRPRWYTAQWNDDHHHALHVLLTGERDGYYGDYVDDPARHLGRTLSEGFAYQGEPSAFRHGGLRGEPSAHLPPTSFVNFLQNHDQIGNRAFGERIDALAETVAVEAALAVLLLAPSPPLLFMGEEWAASQPFLFFCDLEPDLAAKVRAGRRREFARFDAFRDEAARERIPDPNAEETYRRAVLDWDSRKLGAHRERLDLVRRLLAIRHREIVPRLRGVDGGIGRFEALGPHGVEAWWGLDGGAELTLAANLGRKPIAGVSLRDRGRLIYATHEPEEDAGLPPWSVFWRIRENGANA